MRKRLSAFVLRAAIVFGLAFAFSSPLTPAASGQTDERGLKVKPTDQVIAWPANQKRFALVIGIDRYLDGQITRLEGASNDAKRIAETLVQYAGFPANQVLLLTSDLPPEEGPTRGNILRKLSNLRAAIPQDGLLLVSFAGHGIEYNKQAYLLPMDAQINADPALLEDTAINVEKIRDRIRETNVSQVIMIIDACRNDPTSARGDEDNPLTDAYTRGFSFDVRNSEVTAFATLYATEVGYRAYEYKERKQGYFTWALVEGLKGGAANEKGEVTLGGLVTYLQEVVPKRISLDLGKGRKQRPFAIIEGYKADELVISLTRPAGSKSAAAPKSTAVASVEPRDILRSARTVYVHSKSKWFKAAYVETALNRHPAFQEMGLKIVKEKRVADIQVELDRPWLSFTYIYTVINPDTTIVLTGGKIRGEMDDGRAAPKVADEIIKHLQAARGAAAGQPKK